MTWIARFLDYFLDRPWLVVWMGIFTTALVVLGILGQIHVQGDGAPTRFEIIALCICAGVWIAAKLFFRRDLTTARPSSMPRKFRGTRAR